jgi:glycosyltransferase involved in cell wall biosynthesis
MMKERSRRLPITVVVLNRNESHHLQRLLPMLTDWARVLVVDDHSTDESLRVAESLGAQVMVREINGDYAGQRNAALERCRTTWVLFVDADERVTPKLQAEIKQVIGEKRDDCDGYYLSRQDMFLGKKLHHGETDVVRLLRLGKRKAGKWMRPVHEVWQIQRTGYLKHPLIHHSHSTFRAMLEKIRRYAAIEGRFRAQTGKRFSLFETMTYPIGKICQNYVLRRGYKDGYQGLMMALGMSYHSFLVRIHHWRHLYAPISAQPADVLLLWQIPLVLLLMLGGQMLRIQFLGTPVYLFELIMAIGVCLALITWLWERRTFSLNGLWAALAQVVIFLAVSLVINYDYLGGYFWNASLYWWRYLLYATWGFWLYQLSVTALWRFPWRRVMVYWGSGFLLFGWLQYILMPDMRWLYPYGFDDHFNRMVGTLFDPSYLALILLLTLLAVVKEYNLAKPYLLIGLLAGLLLTYARSTYVLLLFSVAAFAIATKRFLWLAGFLVLFGMGVWFLPRGGGEGVNLLRTYSIHSRAFSTLTAWEWFVERPVWGMGFNGYKWIAGIETYERPIPSLPSGPDNSWVLVLATTGMMGGISMSLYLYMLFAYLWREPWMKLSLLVIVLHSMTNNSWFYPWVMVWVYLMIAERGLTVKAER